MRPARCGWRATRRGNLAVIVAVCLTVLMAVVALAIDGGNLLDDQRQCQAAADAAALAAACQLYANYAIDQGQDPSNNALNAALAVASANGYNNDGITNNVYVNIPPKYNQDPWKHQSDKPYKNVDGYVEVIIEYHQPPGFSRVLGSTDLVVRTRAVARGAWVKSNAGVLVLDFQGGPALSARGSNSLTETGGAVIVNCNTSSTTFNLGGGTLTAQEFDTSANDVSLLTNPYLQTTPVANQVFLNQHPIPDPLGYLPALGDPNAPYTVPSAANVPTKNGTVKATATNYYDAVTNQTYQNYYLLAPGAYGGTGEPRLPNFTNSDLVVFQQASVGNNGIYYLTQSGLNSSGASLRMDSTTSGGIMIYNAGNATNDAINLSGSSGSWISLGPPTSGPYSGIVIWQARNAPEDVQITGDGSFDIQGTIYAAGAKLKVTGNGGTFADGNNNNQIVQGGRIGSQYISKDLEMAGNGNVRIDYNCPMAKTRILSLVE